MTFSSNWCIRSEQFCDVGLGRFSKRRAQTTHVVSAPCVRFLQVCDLVDINHVYSIFFSFSKVPFGTDK